MEKEEENMKATIEKIKRRASDNACILKVVVLNEIDSEQLRRGTIELTQGKYKQTTLGE